MRCYDVPCVRGVRSSKRHACVPRTVTAVGRPADRGAGQMTFGDDSRGAADKCRAFGIIVRVRVVFIVVQDVLRSRTVHV